MRILISFLLALSFLSPAPPATAQQRDLPPIDALVPNFYYDDVEAAKRWWVDALGFRMMIDLGWVAIVELQPGMQIALVDGERGTLRAVEDKGALLVIETEALEQWHAHVASIEGIDWYEYPDDPRRTPLPSGIMEHPEIHEFRVVDPGGYIVEFFRWKPEFRPAQGQSQGQPLDAPPSPDPVTADPATIDPEYPPAMRELSFRSDGSKINGLIYLADGAGPHPTVALLHGYAGNERNLDLAQALRRAGFNVLYFNYRGSWGSGGEFSASNAVDDVAAALATLRERAAEYRVDPDRLVLIGHSFGGFTATMATLDDPAVRCLGFIAGANMGAFGAAAADDAGMRTMLGEALGADMDPEGGPIRARPEDVVADVVDHASRFELRLRAAELRDRPVLLIAGERDEAAAREIHHDPFLAALREAGHDDLTEIVYDDDHYFSANRIALAQAIVDWLRSDCLASDRTDAAPR